MKSTSVNIATTAPLWRRLAAILYDSFLVLALMWITSAIYHAVVNIGLLNLTEAPAGFNPLLSTLLTFVIFWFFAYFWTKNGQTLGMQAWKIKVRQKDGKNISLWQSLLRFMVAIPALGLFMTGVLWMKIDKQNETWQDKYSMTETIYINP